MGPWAASVKVYRPRCGLSNAASLKKRKAPSLYANLSNAFKRKGMKDSKCSSTRLSIMIAEFREFMDKTFGAGADEGIKKKLTLIPAKLFEDFSEGGPVHCIIEKCFQFAAEKHIDMIQFLDASKKDIYISLLLQVDKRLKELNHLQTVKAFIASSVSERDTERLRTLLQRHSAAVLSSPDVATHIIYPDPAGTREHQTDSQVLVRLLRREQFDSQQECFVHWLYHPDSFNDWVTSDEILGHVYTPTRRSNNEPWHVHCRWVRDLDTYNEWMNELDYEMPPSFDEFVGRPPSDVPTLRTPGGVSKVLLKLRISKEKDDSQDESQADSSRVLGLPGIESERGNKEKTLGMGKEEKEERNRSSIFKSDQSNIAEDEASRKEHTGDTSRSGESHKNNNDQNTQPEKFSLGDGVFMPSFAKWFEMSKVHDIERRALPEFFSGMYSSKTSQTYCDIRNFIIRTWRRKPTGYLSGTAARRYLSGDACSVLRVHSFLEHWGLINYACPDAAPPPSFNPPPRPLPVFDSEGKGLKADFQILLDDGGRAELVDMKVLKFDPGGLRVGSTGNLLPRDSDRGSDSMQVSARPAKAPVEYHCDSCKVDCSVLRFHCATKADVDLCAACYQAGRYASDMKPRDFIQMNSTGGQGAADDSDPNVWTESEILLLLEALEMFSDKWNSISEHVGSKSKSQCVIKFLQLPIEDAFLQKMNNEWWSEHPAKAEQMPSPLEIMRKAGARESSLAAVAGKGSARRTHSGQPLICADQTCTVVPFLAFLSSECPLDKLDVLFEALNLREPQRRIRNPFYVALQQIWKTKSSPAHKLREQADISEVENLAFTEEVYRSVINYIHTPEDVLKSEYGEYLQLAVSALVGTTPAEGDELDNLRFYDSWLNCLKVGLPGNQMTYESFGRKPAEAQGSLDDNSEVNPEAPTSNYSVNMPASHGVAVAALVSSCVSAAQWLNAEDLEVDRLFRLCLELRMAMIRLKMKHLMEIDEHLKFSRCARKRYMHSVASETIRMKKQRIDLCSNSNPITAPDNIDDIMILPAVLEASPVPSLFSASYVPIPITGGETMKKWTDARGFTTEMSKLKLPDFSEEEILEDLEKGTGGHDTTGESREASEEDNDDVDDADDADEEVLNG